MVTVTSVLFACTLVWLAQLLLTRSWWRAQQQRLLRRHRDILGALGDLVLVADAAGHIVEANETALRLLGYERHELLRLALSELCADLPHELPGVSAARLTCEAHLRHRDGRAIAVGLTLSTVVRDAEHLLCIVGSDAEHRRVLERELRESESRFIRLRDYDAVTSLPNRASLRTCLARTIEQQGGTAAFALLYLDLDHFKHVNDSRGHEVGDQLLQAMANQLRGAIGAQDVLFRIGEDEFLVVAPGAKDAAAARALAQRLLNAARSPVAIADATLLMTASIGAAVYPRDGEDADTLLQHADIALFRAKEQGRNCIEMFAAEMTLELQETLALEQELRRAVETDQLYVEYQPLVELDGGVLVSFEALARWRHPQLGLISPAKFIAVAERSGLIITLGERVLRDVIVQLRRWHEENVPLAPVAINVAAMQLERTEFPTLVHELCMEYDVDPKWLSFELTESVWVRSSNKHIVAIDTLRHGGSLVAIDDFGTGFSNLSYLRELPVDAVKIDRSFVTNVATDPSDAAIVSGVVAMARSRQLSVVAEGVETVEQIEKLRELGCDRAQGYYFGKPMSAFHCRALLEQLGTRRRLTETAKVRAFKVAQQ